MPGSDQRPAAPGSTADDATPEEAAEGAPGPVVGRGLPAPPLADPAAGTEAGPDTIGFPLARTSISRELLRLGWPVMLSQSLVSAAGLVDRAMIGRLGGELGSAVPLAAVGYAAQFFTLIQSALFAVGLACVALMARSIGAGRPEVARQALASAMQVAVAVSLGFSVLILAAPRLMLGALGAAPDVIDAGLGYLQLAVGSSVLLAVVLTLDSAQRANRNTRIPMLVSIVITLSKLGLNYLLIFGEPRLTILGSDGLPALGLDGAGWATAISQALGLGLYLLILRQQPNDSPARLRWRALLRPGPLGREVVRIAAPGVAERVVLNLGLLSYFWVLSNYYGTLAVAAYAVGVPLLSFSWIPGSGYAQAAATLVGQQLGAGSPTGAERTGRRAAMLALCTAIPLGLVFALWRYELAALFTDDRAVIEALGPFMLALSIGQPFLQLHFTLGGVHRGAGDTWTPLLGATLGNWVVRVPLALLCAAVLEADVIYVWLVMVCDHLVRLIWLAFSFRRGAWKTREVGV